MHALTSIIHVASSAGTCHAALGRQGIPLLQPSGLGLSSCSHEANPGHSPHSIAAVNLLDAMATGGALDHAIGFPVLLQALVGFFLAALPLVLIAALVAVPRHIALPAPLVLARVAHQRRAVVLCSHMLATFIN